MPNATLHDNTYGAVAGHLRQKIHSMAAGERLPTVRGLMREFGVGQSVVDKALTILRQEGIIDAHVGRGMFVRSPGRPRCVERFDVFLFDYDSAMREGTFHHALLAQLGRQLGSRGQSIRIRNLGTDASYPAFDQMLAEADVEAMFIDGIRDLGLLEAARQRKIPYVLIFPNQVLPQPSSVEIDNASAMRSVFDHLRELGHRRLACIHSHHEKDFYRDLWERHSLFYKLVAEYGLQTRPEWVRFGGFTRESGLVAARAALAAADEKPTAIVTNDYLAQGVYHALQEAGLAVSRDVSVIGFDDMPWAAYLDPPLTTMRIPINEVAAEAVAMMDRVLADGQVTKGEPIKPQLTVRGSTRPVLPPAN